MHKIFCKVVLCFLVPKIEIKINSSNFVGVVHMAQFKDFNALVSSCNQNGGLYQLNRKNGQNIISKILDCECRGIARYGTGFIVVSNEVGIIILDGQLNIIKTSGAGKGLDLHGVAVRNELAYIVETKLNCIGIYSLTEEIIRVDEVCLSEKRSADICHINDLYIEGSSLFISMFRLPSLKSLGGGIIEYCLKKGKVKNVLLDQISQPHSVLLYNNEFYFCNSEEFTIQKGNQVIFKGQGYTRGLAIQNDTILIGQSTTRHLDELLKKHTNISSDCGISLFNKNRKIYTFIPIPSFEIYGIIFV